MNDVSPFTSFQKFDETDEIDQVTLDLKLKTLKAIDIKTATVSVYVVEISKTNKMLRCKEAKLLECDPALLAKFGGYVASCISENSHISVYSDITTNQDNRFFYIDSSETDFPQILKTLHPSQEKEEVKQVSEVEELKKFNAYIIEIYRGQGLQPIYGFRYVSQSWSPRNSSSGFFKLDNDMVATFDESPIFRIDPYLDFIAFGEDLYIMNCAKFEMAMQFKDRLIERKNETVVEIRDSKIFVVGDELKFASIIGTDKHFLRQLSSVRQKEFYKNLVWISKLRNVAQEAGNWVLEFDSAGKIIVKEEKAYVRELLIVLQNKRVQTVIDKIICDVDGELTAQVTR